MPEAERVMNRTFINCMLIVLFATGTLWFGMQIRHITRSDAVGVYGVDLAAYHTAARLFKKGETGEIYNETEGFIVSTGRFYEEARQSGYDNKPARYLYLPVFILPYVPTADLPFSAATTLWLIVNCGLIGLTISVQCALLRGAGSRLLLPAAVVVGNLFCFPLFYALKLGQTTLFIYCGLCVLYWLHEKQRDLAAGIVLGVVVSLKPYLLLLLAYFAARKKKRLVTAGVVTVVCIVVLSLLIFGFQVHQDYIIALQSLSGASTAGWSNQSLEAFWLRLSNHGSIIDFTLCEIPAWGLLFKYGLVGALAIVLYRRIIEPKAVSGLRTPGLAFSVAVLICLLVPSFAWQHYFVCALLPLLLIARSMAAFQPRPSGALVAVLPLAYFFIALPPLGFQYIQSSGYQLPAALAISLPLAGVCLLLGLVFLLTARDSGEESP